MSDDESPRRYAAPALEKGLDILELLSQQTEGLAQSEVARRLDRTPSEIFRMLNCLERRGYLDRSTVDDLYRLTPRLFELAHCHPPIKKLLEAAMPVMRRLAVTIDQSCHMAISHDTEALVVAQVDSPGFLGFAVRIGARAPLHDSCSGKILLAFLDEERRSSLLGRVFGESDAKEREELMRGLADIRGRNYEHRNSAITKGIVDVGAPILDHTGVAVASLTTPCISRVDRQPNVPAVAEQVMKSALEITRMLGG